VRFGEPVRPRLKEVLVRSALLFLVSVALVAGFWFHAEFYRIGLLPMLALGGLATFLVMAAVRAIVSGRLPWHWGADKFVLSIREAERVSRYPESGVVVSGTTPTPRMGRVVRIATGTGTVFGTARVANAHRALLGDLTREDLRRCGWEDPAAFRKEWESSRPWRSEDPVTVVSLYRLGGGAP